METEARNVQPDNKMRPIFALGPEGRFFYQTTSRAYANLPGSMQAVFDLEVVDEVHCVAFGPLMSSYAFTFTHSRTKTCEAIFGAGTPPVLQSILQDMPGDDLQDFRFSLGPNDSWVAWNGPNPLLLSQNIPAGLEYALKEWYKAPSWTQGAPAFISLGAEGSYFAASTGRSGQALWSIPDRFSILKDNWNTLWTELGQFSASNILCAFLSPCVKDRFVILERSRQGLDFGRSYYSVSQGVYEMEELLSKCRVDAGNFWDSLPGEMEPGLRCRVRKFYKKREPNEITLDEGEYVEILKQCSKTWWFGRTSSGKVGYFPMRYVNAPERAHRQERRKTEAPREERRRTEAPREERRRTEMPRQEQRRTAGFAAWETRVKSLMQQGDIREFPHIPRQYCLCGNRACYEERQDPEGLQACKHDVETFLRNSGMYSHKWLKSERLQWHPDQFGKKCDPELREGLQQKAQKLFVVFGQLMDEAVGDGKGRR